MRIKALFWLCTFMAIASISIAQEGTTRNYYQTYQLNFNKTDQLSDPVEAGNLKEGEYYFVVETKEGQTQSIGYYDHQGNIQTYLLDRYYNLYFQYITYQYEKGKLVSKQYKNTKDFVLSRIDFKYNGNENNQITATQLWAYSLQKRKMEKIVETKYTYQGENYDVIERLNIRDQIYEKIAYQGSQAVQQYERYDIDGKTLQYRVKFYYENNQLARKEFYSRAGVLLRTVYEPKGVTGS